MKRAKETAPGCGGYNGAMKVAQGTVAKDGRVVVDGERLPEGSRVAVYVEEAEGFALDDASKRGLLDAMQELDRGEYLTPDEVFARLAAK